MAESRLLHQPLEGVAEVCSRFWSRRPAPRDPETAGCHLVLQPSRLPALLSSEPEGAAVAPRVDPGSPMRGVVERGETVRLVSAFAKNTEWNL